MSQSDSDIVESQQTWDVRNDGAVDAVATELWGFAIDIGEGPGVLELFAEDIASLTEFESNVYESEAGQACHILAS